MVCVIFPGIAFGGGYSVGVPSPTRPGAPPARFREIVAEPRSRVDVKLASILAGEVSGEPPVVSVL